MRLVILCEGDTEEHVLKEFLAPYCGKFDRVTLTNMRGAGRLKNNFKDAAEIELQSNPDAYVVCLIDVYEAPFSYPGDVAQAADPTPVKFAYIKKYMEDQIADEMRHRFFAFPVVMEIETWLLADPAPLNNYLQPNKPVHYHTPETILHPVAELKDLFWREKKKEYSKVIDGQRLFKEADAQKVYADNCPHFEQLINQLRRLQGETVDNTPATERGIIPNEELYQRLDTLEEKRNQITQELDTIHSVSDPRFDELAGRENALEAEINAITRKIKDYHQTNR